MKNKRPPSNTESLIRLKDQQYDVRIEHYRAAVHPMKDEIEIVNDRTWRKPVKMVGHLGDVYDVFVTPRQMGGGTKLTLTRGEEEIVVLAFCNEQDRFCRRIGVKTALAKLKKLHDIE